MTEGYIRFNCIQTLAESPSELIIADLNTIRNYLYKMGLIGCFEDGIGFGNVSKRTDDGRFIISGSQTGGLPSLESSHYCFIDDYDIDKNIVNCSGTIKASSETMTHAAIYTALSNINYVAHIHNKCLWTAWLNKMPSTDANAEYGTPGMAHEVSRLCGIHSLNNPLIIVMAGHTDGIILASETAKRILTTFAGSG